MKPLWAEPDNPNPATALGGYISSGAPLVAGFELAAVVLVLTDQHVAHYVPLAGPAIAAMIASAALMVSSIRYGFWAVSYWTTPAERLMWDPAAVVSLESLMSQRFMLAGRMFHFQKLRARAEHLFEVGLILFLLAVALMLIPDRWHASGTGWRWAAVALAGFAFLVHLAWSVGKWLHERFLAWLGQLESKAKKDAKPRTIRMKFAKLGDKVLVSCLGLIWPPAHETEFDDPEPPAAADLFGIRRS